MENENIKSDVPPSDASGCSGADVEGTRSESGLICECRNFNCPVMYVLGYPGDVCTCGAEIHLADDYQF